MKLKLKSKPRVEENDDDGADGDGATASLAKAPWMSQGLQAAKKEVAKNKSNGAWTPDFWLKDGEEADIRVITQQPINIYQHNTPVGAQRFANRTCPGEGCPLCESGNKKRFVAVFTVIDRRKEKWTDKQGKAQSSESRLKTWRCGSRIMAQLENLLAKKGDFTGYDINVSRTGKGKDSTYILIPGDRENLSSADKELLKKPLDLMKILEPKARQEPLGEMSKNGATDDDTDNVDKM